MRNRKTSVSVVPTNAGARPHRDSPDADEVDVLTSSLSALRFVPASVSRRLEADLRRSIEE